MALDLTQEQKAQGRNNFAVATGELTRRGFVKSMAAGTAVVPLSAAAYFGYDSWKQGNKPVRTAIIGAGDEGGVLIGEHNPAFNEIVAVCDVRPYNIKRIFDGDSGPRKGLKAHYGADDLKKIKTNVYDDYKKLIADKDKLGLEAVIIATPLHLHHPMALACMDAGLHVLCEKLMARSIKLCKEMIKKAKDKGVLLSIGHQRHYSTLYAHAREVVEAGILGDIKHIRCLWHRNNSWPYSLGSEKEPVAQGFELPTLRDGWCKPVYQVDADALKDAAKIKEYGYDNLEQLVRWRLYDKTGGGLMAELGSHQLDASSIFLGKVHPLAVYGCGGKFFYGPGRNDRESDDGVFVTYEFPGKNHPKGLLKGKDESDIVVVTYTSFNTNSFEEYGECLMGSRGTMVVEREADVYLFRETEPGKAKSGGKDTAITVGGADAKKPAMEASSTWGAAGAAVVKAAGAGAWDTAVRGYRTEMEHFAYCVRKWQEMKQSVSYEKVDGKMKYAEILPRCHGEIAMADAIIALTANMSMKKRTRIEFEESWFNPEAMGENDVPEKKHG
jgi:predicted dehydrogenase